MNKTNYFLIGAVILVSLIVWGFNTPSPAGGATYEWKEITTLESAVAAGFGRSQIIDATADKSELVENYTLKNIFSATGINFENIVENEKTIMDIITDTEKDGWELFSRTANTFNADTKRQRMFMIRYLFRKKL